MIKLDLTGLIDYADTTQRNIDGFFESSALSSYVTEVLGESFTDVWDSRGAAIGQEWGDVTLVQTGNLRASLVSPVVTRLTSGWRVETTVPYASFVNDRYEFMGLTDEAVRRIGEYVVDNLMGDR